MTASNDHPENPATTAAADRHSKVPLFFYFWLPAGKDAFGFKTWDNAKLNAQRNVRSPKEWPIARRFLERFLDLKQNLTGFTATDELDPAGSKNPRDAELALRKIQTTFVYRPAETRGVDFLEGSIHGEMTIFSNGLYLWRFEIDNNPRRQGDLASMEASLVEFLRHDFFPQVIHELFGLNWHKEFQGQAEEKREEVLEGYNGVLTYYQMDLLYNALFNINAAPAMFFGEETDSPPVDPKNYSLENVFRSIAMYSWNREYRPLYPGRKDYSLRGNYERESDTYVTDRDIFDPVDTSGSYRLREILYSRLTYAAMEHFVRIAITFGILPYKEGLDFCGKRILKDSFLSRINRATGQLYPIWLSDPRNKITSAFDTLESYHSLLARKIPSFIYLQLLVDDLRNISQPVGFEALESRARKKSPKGYGEWSYCHKTLGEAIQQLSRQVAVLKHEVDSIGTLLQTERERRTNTEITELRKLFEMVAERADAKLELDPSFWNRLGQLMQILALFVAVITAYLSIGTWIIDAVISTSDFLASVTMVLGQHWLFFTGYGIVGIGLFVLFLFWYRRTGEQDYEKDTEANLSMQVFDFPGLRERLDFDEFLAAIKDWRHLLPDLNEPTDRQVECLYYENALELPTKGVKRRKYSFRSGIHHNAHYLLHIEVEHHRFSRSHFLTDVRLVIKHDPKATTDFENVGNGLIEHAVRSTISRTREEFQILFRESFGFEYGH